MLSVQNKRRGFGLKKWQLALAVVTAALVLCILIFAAIFNVYLNTPASKDKREISFEVKKGDGVREISANLKKEKLIKNDLYFLIYLKINGLVSSLRAGEYNIALNNTPRQVADILTKGKIASRKITIPEGWTNRQIAEYLDREGVVSKSDFLIAAKKHYGYTFLKDLPTGASLEGFLFPDTYQISLKATADDIVKKMLENFDEKYTTEMRNQVAATKLNTFEVVTLASVVEREVSKPEDRKIVAGIFWSRLNEDMPLQSDATIQYILNSNKKIFSYDETKVESPYNTYLYKGLPAGPIGNPGLDSIKAVINPEKTDFLYFLSANDVTYYSKTLSEHEAKRAKYLE